MGSTHCKRMGFPQNKMWSNFNIRLKATPWSQTDFGLVLAVSFTSYSFINKLLKFVEFQATLNRMDGTASINYMYNKYL